jgi:TonB family protein
MRPPVYPQEALSQHVAGTVWLHARVGTDGKIDNLDLEDAQPAAARALGAAAMAAVKDWTFNPASTNSQPVAADVIVPVEFAIEGQTATAVDAPSFAANATQLAKIRVVGKLE